MKIGKKIYLFGNFGYFSNDLNGQPIRSRTVLESIRKYKPDYAIYYTDTSFLKNAKGVSLIKILISGLYHWLSSRHIVLLPAQSAVTFVPIISYYTRGIRHNKTHFIAIGGWLDQFLINNTKYLKYFKAMDHIYVQTRSLQLKLENIGLKNLLLFPNYRIYQNGLIEHKLINHEKKLVFLSRVAKEKGIELAIEAINILNNTAGNRLTFDIYGPVKMDYSQEFFRLITGSDSIFYKGVLEPDQIRATLAQYDIMLFPSYYEGEGFPGAVLDAMSAGVPVIASDWKYNAEIIKNGRTGLICKSRNTADLVEKIRYLTGHADVLKTMKENCLAEAKRYHETNVAPILIDNFT